jgi:hypothetical protein
MYPVKVSGGKVVLREFRSADEDAILAIVGDDRVTDWLSFDRRDRDGARAMLHGAIQRAQLDPRTEYYLAVTLPDADRLIGFVRIGLDGIKAGKLGYAIHADEWGNGYATDAAMTMTDFGSGSWLAQDQCGDRPRQRPVDRDREAARLPVRGPHPRSCVHRPRLARQPVVLASRP